jgi:hypothetical protein
LQGIEVGFYGRPFHRLFNVTTELFQFLNRTYFFVLVVIALDVSPYGQAYDNSVSWEKAYGAVKIPFSYAM